MSVGRAFIEMRSKVQDNVQHDRTLPSLRRSTGDGRPGAAARGEGMASQGRHTTSPTRVGYDVFCYDTIR